MKPHRLVARVAPVLAALCAVSACGGTSTAEGVKQAKQVRTQAARTYWRVRGALPASLHLDEPHGSGRFVACGEDEKGGGDAVRYDLFDYLVPVRGEPTMARLLAGVESGLRPQGWIFTPYTIPDSAMPDPQNEKLYGWRARKGDETIDLTLHEAHDGLPASGNFDVLSTCEKYGDTRKRLLAAYTGGASRDSYRPSSADPTPVPTGFPTAL